MRPEAGPTQIAPHARNTGNPLAKSAVLAVVTISASGIIRAANDRFARLVAEPSAAALRGRRIDELFATGYCSERWELARREGATGLELALETADGQQLHLRGDLYRIDRESSGPLLQGVFVDVSEEIVMRQALQRGARLEALGSLTSGVAHDFNNLLTVLVGNLSLAAEEVRSQPALFTKLKSARDAARRGADLIHRLLSFASRESVEADVLDPVGVVEDLIALLQRALGSRIELDTRLEAAAGPVRGSVAMLESAVVNLAINARDALGPVGGKVGLEVKKVRLSRRQAETHHVGAGEYVSISVTDNGGGIPAEVLKRVFEPFFSTKRDSGGTGLGLGMVRAFAEQSGGTVTIDSAVGRGTKVSILLPRCVDNLDETAARTMPLSKLPTGDERVVVLSSEEGLRSTVREILELLGYRVTLAAGGAQFTDALRGAPELLIVDGAQAGKTSAAIAAMPETIKTVMLTAGADEDSTSPGNWSTLLHKPFSLADLAETVRRTLDGR
jgi:signal transduction histidine kinase/CheY-like chemotaxis protein